MWSDYIKVHCKKMRYSDEYRDYWLAHPFCEVCKDEGVTTYAEPPHHIKTRGAGGKDTSDNLISLCHKHHMEIHNIGKVLFCERHNVPKIKATL